MIERGRVAARNYGWFGPAPVLAAVLALAVLVLYAPVLTHDFVDFDDDKMVTENSHVRAGLTLEGIRWSLTSLQFFNWLPVTWWSHMADVSLFGMNAGGHHMVSASLHALNAALLFLLLRAVSGVLWAPLIAAALFALHPLRVESVAWVAERKDVLSTVFWLLATLAYVRWCRRPSWARYGVVVLLFALGLMAKPMLVTLPCTLLLLDFWPLGRVQGAGRESWGRLLAEKAPLFALAGATACITFIAQEAGGAVARLAEVPAARRLGNAIFSYGWYLAKTVWPSRLRVPYISPPEGWPVWQILSAAAVLAGGTALVVLLARRRPYLLVGWLWYLGTLVPVIGFVQVGAQGMADRYTYIPLIGLAIIVGWVATEVGPVRKGNRLLSVALGLAAAFALAGATRCQLRYWKDTNALFSRTIAFDSENFMARNNLGVRAAAAGRWNEAAEHFRLAAMARPLLGITHFNRANALENLERAEEAALEYGLALRTLTAPEQVALVHLRLVRLLEGLGRGQEVAWHLEQAVMLEPGNSAPAFDLGTVYLLEGRNHEAAELLSRFAADFPENADGHANLGYVLLRLGRTEDAVREFATGSRLRPEDPKVRHEYGQALRRAGREQEALSEFREALRLQPGYKPALAALAGR